MRDLLLCVPGGMNPARITYAELLPHLPPHVEPLLKDHELYAGPRVPPAGWSLATEAEAILRAARARDAPRFHLLGYSGGGAIALKLAALHPGAVRSLALVEPAWIGRAGSTPVERTVDEAYAAALARGDDLTGFLRVMLQPDEPLPPPPPRPPPPWMATRPAGFRAFMAAFEREHLDLQRLAALQAPVYLAFGDRSNDAERAKAERLAKVFRDYTAEEYRGLHHLAAPHREEPERFARALTAVWARAR